MPPKKLTILHAVPTGKITSELSSKKSKWGSKKRSKSVNAASQEPLVLKTASPLKVVLSSDASPANVPPLSTQPLKILSFSKHAAPGKVLSLESSERKTRHINLRDLDGNASKVFETSSMEKEKRAAKGKEGGALALVRNVVQSANSTVTQPATLMAKQDSKQNGDISQTPKAANGSHASPLVVVRKMDTLPQNNDTAAPLESMPSTESSGSQSKKRKIDRSQFRAEESRPRRLKRPKLDVVQETPAPKDVTVIRESREGTQKETPAAEIITINDSPVKTSTTSQNETKRRSAKRKSTPQKEIVIPSAKEDAFSKTPPQPQKDAPRSAAPSATNSTKSFSLTELDEPRLVRPQERKRFHTSSLEYPRAEASRYEPRRYSPVAYNDLPVHVQAAPPQPTLHEVPPSPVRKEVTVMVQNIAPPQPPAQPNSVPPQPTQPTVSAPKSKALSQPAPSPAIEAEPTHVPQERIVPAPAPRTTAPKSKAPPSHKQRNNTNTRSNNDNHRKRRRNERFPPSERDNETQRTSPDRRAESHSRMSSIERDDGRSNKRRRAHSPTPEKTQQYQDVGHERDNYRKSTSAPQNDRGYERDTFDRRNEEYNWDNRRDFHQDYRRNNYDHHSDRRDYYDERSGRSYHQNTYSDKGDYHHRNKGRRDHYDDYGRGGYEQHYDNRQQYYRGVEERDTERSNYYDSDRGAYNSHYSHGPDAPLNAEPSRKNGTSEAYFYSRHTSQDQQHDRHRHDEPHMVDQSTASSATRADYAADTTTAGTAPPPTPPTTDLPDTSFLTNLSAAPTVTYTEATYNFQKDNQTYPQHSAATEDTMAYSEFTNPSSQPHSQYSVATTDKYSSAAPRASSATSASFAEQASLQNRIEDYALQGVKLVNKKQFRPGIEVLKKALALVATSSQPEEVLISPSTRFSLYYKLAYAYHKVESFKNVEKFSSVALQFGKKSKMPKLYALRAKARFYLKNFEGAKKDIELAIDRIDANSVDADAYHDLKRKILSYEARYK